MNKVDAQQIDEVAGKAEETIERLVAEQGVSPIDDLDELSALWPADDDPDALMNYVLSERLTRRQLNAEDHRTK